MAGNSRSDLEIDENGDLVSTELDVEELFKGLSNGTSLGSPADLTIENLLAAQNEILERLAAERFVFCEHRGATMSVRAHARMHAEERRRWRSRRGAQPVPPELLEALELELRED